MIEHHDRSCAGMIATKCCPSQVVGDAVMDARSICMREYASAPEVNIYGDPNFTFPYVPSHLHHMTFELVKNSLRAVNDKYDDSDDEPPPIRLVVAEGEEDITIKVTRLSRCSAWHSSCSRTARVGMSVSTQGMQMSVTHWQPHIQPDMHVGIVPDHALRCLKHITRLSTALLLTLP